MSCADCIAKLLVAGGFSSLFSKSSPSALDCAEPIVVAEGEFRRTSRIDCEERGNVSATVMVVREVSRDAEEAASACEKWLRSCNWEACAEDGGWRIAGIDTVPPWLKERDSSGRFVWAFEAACTVVRAL